MKQYNYPKIMKAKYIIAAITLTIMFFSSFLWEGSGIYSQNNMGIGTLNPHPSSLLDLTALDKGLLIPRMTVVQRNAIASPATGLLIYNTDCNVFNYWNGTTWGSVDGLHISSTIGGIIDACKNSTGIPYSIQTVSGANPTGYHWTVPPGSTIASGQGTTSITVNFGTLDGNVCVTASNTCETSDTLCLPIRLSSASVSPVALPASDFTCTSFNANWGVTSGATTYLLDVATDAAFTLPVGIYNSYNVGTVTSYAVIGLLPSTTYYYRVRAVNDCDISLNSNTIIVSTTAPVSPTATAPSNFTCTSANANWGASAGATTYFLEVSSTPLFSSGTFVTGYNNVNVNNVTTYNIIGLTINTNYYYRVRAGNGCDTSLFSNTILVSTSAPVAPTATPASNFTCTSMNANWGASSGATSYFLDVATDAAFTSFVSGYSNLIVNNVTTYNVTNLTANTTYYYRVRADNGCSTSSNSNTITFGTTAPVSPTATPADNFTCTSMNANWGAVSGASNYFLDVATDAAFSAIVTGYNNLNVGNVTTYNIVGLVANTTYYYRVRADNGCSISLNSNTISIGTTAPISPTATPADNFTCTSMNANWGAVPSANIYYLDVAADAAFTAFVSGYSNLNVGNVTTYNIIGLTANTTYYYRVRADNGCSISLNSNTISIGTTAPISPTATAASNFTCTSMNANWGAVVGATLYYLDVATDAAFTAFVTGYSNLNVSNVTTYNITGLIANTTYFYRVRADNGCSISLNSNTVSIGTTAPISPTATAASNFTCTTMNANWGAVPGATTYFLDVATDASFTSILPSYSNLNVGNVTTYNVTGLIANTTYHYRIRADNGCSTSLNSNTISIGTTAPISPTATNASNFTCTSMNANWGAVPGATTYFLDVATDASFTSILPAYSNLNVGNVTTYNVTGLVANTVYHYRIRADNGCSTSLNSNTITVGTTPPISPTATSASNFTCTSMNANWGAVSGAITYFLDVATDASFTTFVTGYSNLNVGNVTTYNITGLIPNTIYHYRLRADNGCSISLNSNTVSIGTTPPISPTATSADNFTCTSLNANWGAVSAATQYFLDVATDASFTAFVAGYSNLNVGNVTTYNVIGLTANTTYYYRVRADNGCLISLNSNTITVATSPPISPTATSASNFTCTSMNANWGAVSGAITYFIDVATDAAFTTFVTGYNNLLVGNVTTYNVTGLVANTTYHYRIRANNGCSTSLNSNTISVGTTAPISPTATAASNFTCTSMNANWGAVSGATQYFIDVAADAAFTAMVPGYNNLNAGFVTTYNVTGLTPNTSYFYRVRADNGCLISLNSNTITVATTAPVSPTATPASNFTCTSMNANWGAVSGSSNYLLDVSTSASFTTFVTGYNNLNVGNVTTYNVTGLTPNTTYHYRVRADNGCSISLNSNTVTVGTTAPLSPTATAASNFTCTSMNANWGAVSGATTYLLDVATDAAFTAFVTGYSNLNTGNVTTYNITGLIANTTYYYRIRADNGCSISLNSNTITVGTTAPIAPAASPADNFTCTSMNANWGAVPGATAYFLDVSTSSTFATFVGTYSNLNVGTATTYNITGLIANTTYYYRIRASNGCSTSLNSNTITVGTTAPIAPAATAASNFTCTSMNANWGAVAGVTIYYLDVATDAAFTSFVTGYSNLNVANVTTYNITGLIPNTTYYYRVRASNGCSTSLNSNTITVGTTAPIAPTATGADNFTCTSMNGNWGAVSGATAYFLDVSTSSTFATFVGTYSNLNVGSATTYNITGLIANTTYYYRIRASNGCSTSLNSNTITVGTTAPIAPAASTASNFTCTSMNANWGAVAGATIYYLDIATDAVFTAFVTGYTNLNVANVTTYNVTGLIANTTYFYRVRASNGCSTSLNSNTITVGTTAPIAPTATGADNFTCTSMNANWGAVSGATAYFIDVSTSSTFATFVGTYSNLNVGSATTENITGLTPNTTYYYRIRASNGCSTSLNSNTITVGTTAPIAPAATSASNFTCTSMNANWGAVAGATIYYLDVATDAAFTAFVTGYSNLNVANVTTYNITGLTPNTTYYYRIRASNGCSTSLNSNTITVGTTAPVSPTATAADNFTCTSMNANWGAVSGATAYFLDVSTSSTFATFVGTYSNLNVGSATTYNITGLIANTTYYYRIRASNGCSISLNSNTITVGTTAPIAPAAAAASNFTCTSMNANWGAVAGATLYYLDVATDAAFTAFVTGYSNLNVGSVTTYNITGLTANTTYYYRIRASNGCSTSLNSNTITVGTTAPVSPTASVADNFTCTSMNANWGAVSGATAYFLDVSTSSIFATFVGTYSNLNVGSATTYNITGLTPNTTYYYRVRASNGCSISLNSNTITVGTTAPVSPTATAADNFTCTSMNANWGAVSGATAYFLDVSTSSAFATFVGTYSNLNVANVTTYNITGLTANTTYYYRIRASNGCSTSLNSNTITVGTTAPIAPAASVASNFTCTSMNANWGAVSGATIYYLDVATDAAFTAFVTGYSNLNVGSVTTYNITGLTANTTYYYRIRASNGCSTSLNSNTITVGTTAPVSPTATAADNFTCTTMNANWGAVSGATAYFLDVSTSSTFATFVGTYSNLNVGSATTYNITGLTPNTTYYYRIRASNGCSISLNSNTITVGTTAPIAPAATPASNFTCTSMNANWGAVAGATIYYLDVSTVSTFATFAGTYNNLNVANVTTYNITGLTANTTYYYRMRASNGCSTSLNSNTITVGTTAPVAPTATDADNFTCTSMNANWGAVSGATAYFIDVSTSSTFATFVGTYSNLNVGSATTENITGLTANTTYYYRVRASNGCSVSLNSNTITVGTTAPIAPAATPASNFTCTSMNANWGAVVGATIYYLDVSTSASFATFVGTYNNLNVANVTTYNITGLTANTTYYYRIRASNGCSTSLNSNTITVGTTAPVSPTATDADNFTCTSMNANWGAVTGATAYFLDVSTSATFATFVGTYSNLNVGSATTYNITGLTANTTYYYRIRASNGCSTSLNSNTITVGTTAPIAPTATSASNFTCTSMNANWGAVFGATIYYLDVATDAAFTAFVTGYNNLNVGSATTYNVTGLIANTTYHYRIRASNGCSTSLNSNTISVGTTAPVSPTATAASNFTCTSMNANWGAVSGATTYFLDVATDAAFTAILPAYSNLNAGNVTTLNVTGLTVNTVYYYRVRASNGCSTSLNSNTINIGTTAPIAPTAVAASNFTCTSMNANWAPSAGATTYFLDVSTSSSFGTFVGTYNNLNVSNVTTYNLTGLTINTTYYYRIRASNGCSTSLNSNTTVVVTAAPFAPTALAADNFTCTSMNANWGTVSGATAYFLDVATDAAFTALVTGYSNLNVGNVTTYNITGLTINTTYYYRIRASNGCSTSLNSNSINVGTIAPIAPTALNASNFTCVSMNANWSPSVGAITYFLDVATDAAFTAILPGYSNLNTGNITTYNITGLAANTTYYYRIRASNGCSTSLNSNTINVSTTAPDSPNALPASNFTCTTLNANWAASAGATAYYLDVSTTGTFSTFVTGYSNLNVGNTTTYNVTGLTVNTIYYYRVRAGNGCSISLNSNIIVVITTGPVAPNALEASNLTCTSMNANWALSPSATGYFLDVATDAAFTTFVAGYNNMNVNNVSTYNVIGLSINTTYYYRVRAVNGCNTSLNSNTITVITSAPIAPIALPASNFTCTSFNANWGAVNGAITYYLDVATDAAFTAFVTGYSNLNVNNVNTYNITGLVVNTTYYYRIRAVNVCSTSLNSNSILVTTSAPVAPTSSSASNLTCTSLNANWGAVAGATDYFLDVATDAAFTAFVTGYSNLNVNNVTTYNVTGLTVNTAYYYRVRAGNGCSVSLNSNTIMIITAAPFAPVGLPPDNVSCTSMNANWGGSVGATNYYLDVSTSTTFATFVGTYNNLNVNNVTTYNITGLTIGNTYYYRVRAGSGCSTSLNSNTVSITITAPNAPLALTPSNVVCVSMNANWGTSQGAITYFLDVATDASFTTFVTGYNNLNVNNVTTYNVTGLSAGITYYYRVRAANGCSTSLNSNYIMVLTSALSAPVAFAADGIACTVFNAHWAAVPGIITYFLDVSTSPSFATFVTGFNNLNTGNVLTYNVTGLTVNTTYYYRVRAMSGCTTSPNSNTILASTNAPAAPVATDATNVTCTSMNTNWSAVPGAITYYLDVATDASFTTFLAPYTNFNVGNVTTYNVTGLTGTTVYFRVRAASGCASGSNSNFIMVNPAMIAAPVAFNGTGIACTVFNANWAAVGGALSYFIDVSTSPSFAPGAFVTGFNNFNVGNVLSQNVTGLTVNTTYYYRVRAMNACVTSANSNYITVGTWAPSAPVAIGASNITCASMSANWNSSPGALTYYLDIATDAAFTTFVGAYNNFNVGNVLTYNAVGLPGTTVYYRVRAASGCASGPNSNFIVVNPASIPAPAAFAASSITCIFFNANWGAVSGAIGYFLDVSTSSSFAPGAFVGIYNNLDVHNVLTYNVTGLSANNFYYYRVRAVNACVTSLNSPTITASTFAPTSPNGLTASNLTCGTFNANWGAVSGALGYYLDVSLDPAFSTFVGVYNNLNVNAVTTFNVTGLSMNTIYYYRVRAYNGCSTGGNSTPIISVQTTTPTWPTPQSITSYTCSSFLATWNTVGGATSYVIDVAFNSTFTSFLPGYQNLNVGNVTSRNVTGISSGILFYYRLRSVNNCGVSGSSPFIAFIIDAPTIPAPSSWNSCTSFGVNWGASPGATGYFVDLSTNASFTTFVTIGANTYNNFSVGNVTTIGIAGLTQGINYYYRMRSANTCGISGNSNIIHFITGAPAPPTPGAVTAISCTSFNASWTGASGSNDYFLDVSTSPTFATFFTMYHNLDVGFISSFNVSGLTSGTNYYWRIRGTGGCDTSGYSGTTMVSTSGPIAPVVSAASPISSTSFTANWAASANATTYYLDVATDNGFVNYVNGFNSLNVGNVTSQSVTGLTTGTPYYYRVRASNGCGTSLNSGTMSYTTP